MSRPTTSAYRNAINAAETGEAILTLLTLNDYLGNFFRFTNNSVDVVSNGETFLAWPFEISLPNAEEGRISAGSLTFDNVGRTLIDEIRAQPFPLSARIDVVLGSDPDALVATWKGYEWRALGYDAVKVTGTLTLESFSNEPFPGKIMSAQGFSGLFFG